jgi:hypothetical protein
MNYLISSFLYYILKKIKIYKNIYKYNNGILSFWHWQLLWFWLGFERCKISWYVRVIKCLLLTCTSLIIKLVILLTLLVSYWIIIVKRKINCTNSVITGIIWITPVIINISLTIKSIISSVIKLYKYSITCI